MIKLFSATIPTSVNKPLLKTLHSGYITQGPRVDEFEKMLQSYFKTPYILTVNSGTSALTLALRCAGVQAGDEVITTPMTCSATNLPILALGGEPVFADIHPKTGNIDPESVEKLITERTRAIMCVAWGGLPADTACLRSIADKHGLYLIEDAAHAMGLKTSQADFVCFSLQAIKHITTGDGGILLCQNKDDAALDYEEAKKLRWFGISRESKGKDTRINEDIEHWGYKFHMNDINATIGIAQLPCLNRILALHRITANFYNTSLDKRFGQPPYNDFFWLYTLLLPDEEQREAFKDYMLSEGIQVSQVHKRNDEYSVFRPFAKGGLYGVDKFSAQMICIPIHDQLTKGEENKIVESANRFARMFL